jgi:heterodisulfide reductase subunit D
VYAQDKRECVTARGKLASLRCIVNGSQLRDEEQKGFLEGLYECSACGQCHVVCPVRINTPELWEQARLSLSGAGIPQPESQIKQLSIIKDFNNSYGKPQQERGLWAERAWEAGFLKAPLPLWKEQRTKILYFAGCAASFDPEMQSVAVQSARLMQEAGVEFSILGNDEPCCISKLRRMGDSAFIREAQKRIDTFNEQEITTIVVSCAGCYKGFHADYRRLWSGAKRVLHLTEFLEQLIREGRLRLEREVPLVVTYHDPCHLGRHNQIYDPPRRILKAVPGLKLAEMQRHRAFSACCGMGGGLKTVNPEIQQKMGAARIREAESSGAEAIVTPCQTCCLGLLHGVEKAASAMKVNHLNEILIRSVCPEASAAAIKAAFEGTKDLKTAIRDE